MEAPFSITSTVSLSTRTIAISSESRMVPATSECEHGDGGFGSTGPLVEHEMAGDVSTSPRCARPSHQEGEGKKEVALALSAIFALECVVSSSRLGASEWQPPLFGVRYR